MSLPPRRRSLSRSAPVSVSRHISILNPTAGDEGDVDAPPRTLSPHVVTLLACVSTAAILAAGQARAALLAWVPLGVVVVVFGRSTLEALAVTIRAWRRMKQQHFVASSAVLGDVRDRLELWRNEWKRGGARAAVTQAREAVATATLPLLLALVATHACFSVATSLPARQSAFWACGVVHALVAAVLYLAGELSATMATQREFVASARLRVAEQSYALAADVGDVRESVAALHMHNALAMELCVIETHTSEAAFTVMGLALDSGKASQYVVLVSAWVQWTWDASVVALDVTQPRGLLVAVAAALLGGLPLLSAWRHSRA